MARCLILAATLACLALGQSLQDICSKDAVQRSLPTNDFPGIVLDPDSVTVTAVDNVDIQGTFAHPGANSISYCNVTFAYKHTLLNDKINLWYYLPTPSQFQGRFLATGGGGYAINSGPAELNHGLVAGAVAGMTDGGFGAWNQEADNLILQPDGQLDHEVLINFSHLSIHEMSIIGQQLTKNFYNKNKIYSYYWGCSEGGREGWSQVQRFATQFDGVVVGAPAFRQGYQQTNHLTSAVIEKTLGYAPSPCELDQINNDTIAACDILDGKKDGVVARTDLCRLFYDVDASIGNDYSCPAMQGLPAVKGKVTKEAARVAKSIIAGLFDSQDRHVYISYQPSATFDDARTTYDPDTKTYSPHAVGFAVPWVQKYLKQIDVNTLPLNNVTVDTVKEWMQLGIDKFNDTLQTVSPNIRPFQLAKGKILHYHGESDYSVPTGSSVLYQESVRRELYPDLGFVESYKEMDDWYKLFLIPGGSHCQPSAQPGPWPVTTLETMIDWVEHGKNPKTLNATILSGDDQGKSEQICPWPLRPRWIGSSMKCWWVDLASLTTWFPNLDALPAPVY